MLSVFMVTRCARAFIPVSVCAVLAIFALSCEKAPLLAPSGSTIVITSPATVLPFNGSATILAQVLESSGYPPHSGTSVTFLTTLGTIQPPTVSTDANGRAQVTFLPGTTSGTATISAMSGGATTGATGSIKIAVGSAAVGGVRVGANPASVGAFGGSTTITANVFDINGSVLPFVPVVFATSAGSLTFSVVTTDASGTAQTTLTTTQQATVTATVGAQGATNGGGSGSTGGSTGGTTGSTTPTTGQASGSVTVTVIAAPTLVITPPSTPPSAGLPAAITFVVTNPTNGAVVRNVTVSWGDGQTQTLGVISGSQVVNHVYSAPGSYTVSATMTDSAGNVTTTATSVTVIPVAAVTIVITPNVPSSCTGTGTCLVTFQIQVTPPTGISIIDAAVDYGDGQGQELGGLNGSVTVQHPYTVHGVSETVTVTVTDTLNRQNRGFTTVQLP